MTMCERNVDLKINPNDHSDHIVDYFMPEPIQKAKTEARPKLTEDIRKEFEDVFIEIGCCQGIFT